MSLKSVISAGTTAAALTLVAFVAVPTSASAATPRTQTTPPYPSTPITIVIGIGGMHHDCGFCGLAG